VAFVEDDHVIQALALDRADNPFAMAVLPWRPRAYHLFLDIHLLQGLDYLGVVDTVAIADDEVRRGIEHERMA